MRHLKMQGIGGVVVCLLLQMDFAYGTTRNIPKDSQDLILVKRSEVTSSAIPCNRQLVDNLAKETQEICSHVSSIDINALNLGSRQPVSIPTFSENYGLNSIINQYNDVLKNTQNIFRSWRNGDSILGSVKELVVSAKEFGPKFNKEFEENQGRIRLIADNYENIRVVEARISSLENDIQNLEATKQAVQDHNVQSSLENLIEMKKNKISNISKQHNVLQANIEFDELVKFLGCAKNVSAEIETKADVARTKMSLFKDSVARGGNSFKRLLREAQGGISRIHEARRGYSLRLDELQEAKHDLKKKIAGERTQIAALNEAIQRAQHDLRNIENNIARSKRSVREKRFVCRLFFFFCRRERRVNSVYRKRNTSRKARKGHNHTRRLATLKLIDGHNKALDDLQEQLTRRTQLLASYESRTAILSSKSNELEQQLENFSNLKAVLQSIESEVNTMLPTIESTIVGVSKVRETFDTIKYRLEGTIEKAKKSQTEADAKDVIDLVYNGIRGLKCEWDQANEKMVVVGRCK